MYLEDQIVGSWVAAYEDDLVFEEEVYEFDTAGRWSYRYYYQNVNGEYVYENLFAAGVVDPAKVTRVALENAASIAGMFLTTECVIVEKKEDKPEMPMGAPGMGGMGGMM